VQFNDTTRAYFTRLAAIQHGVSGAAMTALLANPRDAKADAAVSSDKQNHSLLRTTCVATRVDAGHANNALPQRATAIVNCRIFPGEPVAAVTATLERVIADPQVKVVPFAMPQTRNPPVPLDPKVFGPAEKLAEKAFPGVPMLPFIETRRASRPTACPGCSTTPISATSTALTNVSGSRRCMTDVTISMRW
jgi:acetylornithine deacetylase/succinyl-diaminopimelate desuccinylase-like protein